MAGFEEAFEKNMTFSGVSYSNCFINHVPMARMISLCEDDEPVAFPSLRPSAAPPAPANYFLLHIHYLRPTAAPPYPNGSKMIDKCSISDCLAACTTPLSLRSKPPPHPSTNSAVISFSQYLLFFSITTD